MERGPGGVVKPARQAGPPNLPNEPPGLLTFCCFFVNLVGEASHHDGLRYTQAKGALGELECSSD